MRGLLYILIKYGGFVLFVVFECIAFYLIIRFNTHQSDIYINSTNRLSGYIYEQTQNINDFRSLNEQNDRIQRENAELIEKIINLPGVQLTPIELSQDSAYQDSSQYKLTPVRICNKINRLRNNYFTLCNGSIDGLKKGQGVVSKNGIVGRIKDVSDHYALVISLLNTQSGVSALIKDKNYVGTLEWTSNDPFIMTLYGVPKHASITLGDSVITSGYSTIFPPGLFIGLVDNFKLPAGDNNYEIDVRVTQDIMSEDHLYVIQNIRSEEQLELEQQIDIE